MPQAGYSEFAPYDKAGTMAAISSAQQGAQRRSSKDVNRPSKRWEELDKARRLPRTLMGGTDAMVEAGTEFTPRHPAETTDTYNLRLHGATLFNGFAEQVVRQAGKLLSEPIVLKENVPSELVEVCENIDGQGRSLDAFMFDTVKEAFVDGVAFILVDYPSLPAGATMADVRQAGVRPYWVTLTYNNVIGWRTANVNGAQMLIQLRVRERTYEPSGEFGDEVVERVRVLYPGGWELWREEKNTDREPEWVLENEGTTSLGVIPVVPIYINRVGFFEGEPPLRSLAELNREHWNSSTEQRHCLSFSRFSMLALIGVDEENNIAVGPDKKLNLPSGGDAKYIEPGGAAMENGRKDLESIEARMQHAGMQVRVENAGQVTATASAIDSSESNAALRAVAKCLENSVEQALELTGAYIGLADVGEVEVNDNFGAEKPEGGALELLSLRNSSALSLPTLWAELKRRHILSEDFDPDTELAYLSVEGGMAAQGNGADPLTGEQQPSEGENTPPPEE